jgi:PAS domain S-box-containing protein
VTSRGPTRQALGQYVAGFSAVTALGVLLGALSPLTDPGELLAGGIALLVLAAASLLAPWRRLPEWAPATVPIAYYGVFALLRDGAGGSRSLMGPLVVLPLIWLALYRTPRQLLLGMFALLATIGLPSLLIGGSAYPADGWRSVVLWAAVAPLTGFTVQRLVAGQRCADVALRASEEHHRLLVQNLCDAVVTLYERDLRCMLVEGSLPIVRDSSEYVGRELRDIVPADEYRKLEPVMLTALDGEHSEIEYDVPSTGRILGVTVARYRRENGTIDGAFCVWRDVTERRQAELAVLAAEEHFRSAFEHAPVGMAISSPDGRLLDVNLAVTALLGLSRSELQGLRWDDIAHPDGVGILELGAEAWGDVAQYETRLLRGDASIAHVAMHTTLVRDGAGRPPKLLAHVIDIEQSKRAERCRDAQLALTSVLAAATCDEEALAQALPAIGEALGWQARACWLHCCEEGLACVEFWAAEDVAATSLARATSGSDAADGLPNLVWESGRAHWVEDLRLALNSARTRDAVRAGWRSPIGLPVRAEGKLLGVLELFSRELRRPDPLLLELLGSVGSQLREFIQRKRAERSAERLKDEFFATVSHELRTPLTSIVGYLEVLLDDDEELDPTHRRFLGVVERNAQRLVRLVGHLLFAAQVEAGEARIKPVDMDLATIAWEAVESAQPRALAGEVTLELDCPTFAPLRGDPQRLAEALDNVVSNAIKFTPEGGFVEVRIRHGADSTTLEVQDSGIGIPDGEQGRLLERFFRASTVASRVPGVGLGLTIVKAIVEGHGGTLEVASNEGAGTTFRVELPNGEGHSVADAGVAELPAALGA